MSYIAESDVTKAMRGDLESLYQLPDERSDLTDDLAAIEALVDSYVGRRYAVPVTNATAKTVLKAVCLDLFKERAWSRGAGDEIQPKVAEAAKVARDTLAQIRDGKITLAGATSIPERGTGGAAEIIVDGPDPEFTRTQMEGF